MSRKSGDRITKDLQTFYVCGQCETEIFYLKTQEPPSKCPECGWKHQAKEKYDVPSEKKIDLRKY